MEKSPDAFRTISEVAEDLDLPQHVLRFWETRFPQIKPLKRGGGRRYYRPDDVELLKGIRHLLYDHGYTIKGVQKLLKTNGNRFVAAAASGDLATMEALAAQSRDEPEDAPLPPPPISIAPSVTHALPKGILSDDDQLVGRPKPPANRRFFGLIGGGDDEPSFGGGGGGAMGKEDRALLQEALFDLLECKRLLDQVR
jgi:DNA-binding transcriptional MerR regulator